MNKKLQFEFQLIHKWFQARETSKEIDNFIKLQQRKAKIIAYKRKYGIADPK